MLTNTEEIDIFIQQLNMVELAVILLLLVGVIVVIDGLVQKGRKD